MYPQSRMRRPVGTPPFVPEEDENVLSRLLRAIGITPSIPTQIPVEEKQSSMYPQASPRLPALSVATPPFVEPQQPPGMVRPRLVSVDEPAPEGNIVEPTYDSTVKQTRPRLVFPVDPLLKAKENYEALKTMPIDYGQDSQGNERTKPKGGFWGRLGAGLKVALPAVAQTSSPGAALGALATGIGIGAVKNDLPAKMRRAGEIQTAGQEYQGRLAERKVLGDLDEQQTQNEYRRANTEWLRTRPELERDKLELAARKAETAERYIEHRMQLGDRRALTAEGQLELRREWQEFNKGAVNRRLDQGEARLTETQRHNRAVEDALGEYRKETLGLSRERNQISRERSGRLGTPKSTPDRQALARARSIAEKAERFKQAAINEPDEAKRAEYLRAARQEAAVLQTQYPDLFEVGEGEGGWPYVKPKDGGRSDSTADPLGIR